MVAEVTGTAAGRVAGTAVIMYPSGIVAMALSVVLRGSVQLLMLMVSGAPTLSVSVTVTGVLAVVEQDKPARFTATPLYVLLEDVAVAKELDGAIDWLMVAVADTTCPLSPRGSEPLTRFNVPVRL
jgi:hypothetical protein